MTEQAALWLHHATVRPDWVDYNGHMSEAYYVLIFGDATDAFYDHIGLHSTAREAGGVSVYTLEAHIRYLVEAHEGESLRIATRLRAHDAKRLRLHHEMWREDRETLLSVTELMLLHVDKTTLKSSPFAPDILAAIASVPQTQAGVAAVSGYWEKR